MEQRFVLENDKLVHTTVTKTQQRGPFRKSKKPEIAPEVTFSVPEKLFSVARIQITWSNGKIENLYPSDARQKLKYLLGRVAGLKKKAPETSKMFYDCRVYFHALDAKVSEQELSIKGKKKKEVFSLLKNSSKPM